MNTKKITAGVVGAAGYTGGETIRLLLRHPQVDLAFAQSRSQAGKRLTEVHTDLIGETDLHFSPTGQDADVIFLCLSHGESKKLLTETSFAASTRIIDLGNDFRLGEQAHGRLFVYGLPEFQRERIRQAQNVANPGCFATTIQLGLLPLAKAGKLKEVFATGITGSTGAGQRLQDTTHFTWRSNNISAYKTLTHQHLNEIRQTLSSWQRALPEINFVPWRGNFTRGIFVTSVTESDLTLDEAFDLYESFYQAQPFTHVSRSAIDLKLVVNTNKCIIHLEKVGSKLAIHSITDNLLKGASGQAVQNMNLMFGFDETAGLQLKPSVF